MATTHGFVALALVTPVATVAPELATPLSIGAVAGGLAPDLDVAFEHRRTLHFPVLGAGPAVFGLAVVALVPSPIAIAIATFFVAAWVHAASDAVGGGSGFDPWTDPIDRAVFDHRRGRWIRPRRWIRYDGAPEDAALGVALAIPAFVVFDGWVRVLVVLGLAFSLGYALVRRRIPAWLDAHG
ncbi:metal-dependent hydrolase [Halovivax cerinus]|uniref:Metal-dependent hydrolase n=1 Tax=Halovivax cerinus TaxID=1487865 RepID=A0ABD5NTR2_9EURY|nr:metal-dependent hydrolase [Halovivax cerinus]